AKVAGIGGSERHLLTLLPALAGAGLDVRMVVMASGQAGRFIEGLRGLGIEVTALPAGPDVNPALALRLRALIRGCDLVHTHLIHADLHGLIAAKAAGVPSVSSLHSAHSFYARQPYTSVFRLGSRLASRRIAISQHVKDFLVGNALAVPEQVIVVPYGIDTSRWRFDDQLRRRARDGFGIPGGAVAVGVASRLIKGKGHEFLIEAMGRALPEAPQLCLLVGGDGPQRGHLEKAAAELLPRQSYRFCGFVPEIKDFMAACDVLAFPTVPPLSEGFGLAALEAMAAGLPVAASAIGSLPELVCDGETGLLAEPGNVDHLAAALVRLASGAAFRRTLGEAGRTRADVLFSLEKLVERTLEVYSTSAG
ncbi:MAG: glycosyltransferase family 4 protein, partial [Actinomycetota bacterium]